MDKRAGQPMTHSSGEFGKAGIDTNQFAPSVPKAEGGDEAAALKMDIERTRQDMSRTVDAIEERLSPAHLKEQLVDVKESFIAQYEDAKEHIKDDLVNEVRQATDKVKEEIHEAKHAVQEQFEHAKTAVHDATVGRVKHMVVDAKETMTDAGSTVYSTIRANPIPTALVAVGLGWLVMSAVRGHSRARAGERLRVGRYAIEDSSYDVDETRSRGRRMLTQGRRAVGDAVHAVGEKASHLGHRVQDGASGLIDQVEGVAHDAGSRINELGHRATEGASHLAHGVEHMAHEARDHAGHLAEGARDTGLRVARGAERQYHRAEETLENSYEANPLAFGAVSLAVGAAIGLALPHTQREDAWMGQTKDRLLHGAEDLAHDALHKVQEQANELTKGGNDTRQMPVRSEYA